MANRESEELVLRRTVCELRDDPGEVIALLDATFERQDDTQVWHEMFAIDAIDRVVRGVLRLDGPLLTVESNSEERQERLLQTLDVLFDYTVIDDRELDEFDLDDLDLNAGPMDPEDMPDEVRELVEQKMREYEQRLVDESIPALGGLTPRNLASRVESHVGDRALSGFVSRALEHELERDLLDEYLQELEDDYGPPPDGLVEQIDEAWPS